MLESNFEFKSTIDDSSIIKQLYYLCGSQWGGPVGEEKFSQVYTENHLKFLKEGGKMEAFYIRDTAKDNKVVASTIVKYSKSFLKPADKSHAISSVPDPTLFGVKNITGLLISFVFVDKDYRKHGLAKECVSRAIEATEKKIIEAHLNKSDEKVIDNFKKMCIDESTGNVDPNLANYYLSKDYVWYLFSGVDTYYERFGFKSYPLDFYEIPTDLLSEGQEYVVKKLIENSEEQKRSSISDHVPGKRIKLLRSDNESDQDIIRFILQNKELDILTELNKLIFHSDLKGDRRSSASLNNLPNFISMSRLGSNHALSQINETNHSDATRHSNPNRKSSAQNQTIPKFSVIPKFQQFEWNSFVEDEFAPESSKKFADIKGAIITNDLQQKSYYILWNILKGQVYIIGMGEMQFESEFSPNSRRRGSSLSGINELGGFNFQDLDLLISTALHVAKNKGSKFNHVYISLNDLPDEIPDSVIHDFFMNYLPFSSFASEEHREAKDLENKKEVKTNRCELIENASQKLGVLPMLRKFGSESFEFELDWVSNGMWCWG